MREKGQRFPEDTNGKADAPAVPGRRSKSGVYALIFDALVVVGGIVAQGFFGKKNRANRAAAESIRIRIPEEPAREADRPEETEAEVARHAAWGTPLVMCAFGISVAGAAGFLFFYWTGNNNMLMGGSLALFLGGAGAALILSSHLLMRHSQAIEPREELPSSVAERAAASKEYCGGELEVRRRGMLRWMAAAAMTFAAAIVVSLLRSVGMPSGSALFSRVWKRGQRLMTVDGKPVSMDALKPGSSIVVYPENSIGSEQAQTVLIRVQEELLHLPWDRANWAPGGYVAYSRVCPHAGCSVGLYEAETNLLLCPCHQSTFDVLRSARPTGGPAARPLPQLPLYADGDGHLRAGGGFTAPPGPGFSGMPL